MTDLRRTRAPATYIQEQTRSPATKIWPISLSGLPEERCREVVHSAARVGKESVGDCGVMTR